MEIRKRTSKFAVENRIPGTNCSAARHTRHWELEKLWQRTVFEFGIN